MATSAESNACGNAAGPELIKNAASTRARWRALAFRQPRQAALALALPQPARESAGQRQGKNVKAFETT